MCLCDVCIRRFGEIEEVIGTTGYPFKRSRVESLADAMLRFKSGKTATLFCHFVDIPIQPLPFFQVFGDKVPYLSLCRPSLPPFLPSSL